MKLIVFTVGVFLFFHMTLCSSNVVCSIDQNWFRTPASVAAMDLTSPHLSRLKFANYGFLSQGNKNKPPSRGIFAP